MTQFVFNPLNFSQLILVKFCLIYLIEEQTDLIITKVKITFVFKLEFSLCLFYTEIYQFFFALLNYWLKLILLSMNFKKKSEKIINATALLGHFCGLFWFNSA